MILLKVGSKQLSGHTSSLFFRYFLISLSKQLIFHTLVDIKVYLSNQSMNVFLQLLCTWLHRKYSYT